MLICLFIMPAVQAQGELPEQFGGGVWNIQGDRIALISSNFDLWIFTNELKYLQHLEITLPDSSIESFPSIFDLQWSPDSTRLAATIGFEGVVDGSYGIFHYLILWDTTTWQRIAIIQNVGNHTPLAWKPDSTEIAVLTGTFSAELQVLDAETGNYVRTIAADASAIYDFAWHPVDPNEMAISLGNTHELWNPETSQKIISLAPADSDNPNLAYNLQTFELAFVNSNFDVEVWDTQTRQLQHTIEAPDAIRAFSWLGDELLTAESDFTVRRWNVSTGESIVIPTESGYRAWKVDASNYMLFASDRAELIDATTDNLEGQLVLNANSQVTSFSLLDLNTDQTIATYAPIKNETVLNKE